MRARTGDTLPGKATDPGGTAADSRPFVEAVLWRFRTGSPWRDIPERSGGNDSVSRRFRRRVLSGVFGRVSD
ncbi:MAG: transposase, partial [Rhodobacter sp.]|nr:transposase [Rhodobacter sp.]